MKIRPVYSYDKWFIIPIFEIKLQKWKGQFGIIIKVDKLVFSQKVTVNYKAIRFSKVHVKLDCLSSIYIINISKKE